MCLRLSIASPRSVIDVQQSLRLLSCKPFKAEWYLYVPAPLAISKSEFCVYGGFVWFSL
jgi:hypothetical protein